VKTDLRHVYRGDICGSSTKYEQQRVGWRSLIQGVSWTPSAENYANFGYEANSVSAGAYARLFFQENSLGIAISKQLTGITTENKRLDRLFYNYADHDKKKLLEVALDPISLNAARDYYADVYKIQQDSSISREQIRAIVLPKSTAISLKGFYSHLAKATISVGDDVFIGDDNWLCRINRIIQHQVTVNEELHTNGKVN
jgi:hypothetical protein